MRRFIVSVAVLAVASFGACRWLLPERFAVNAPIAHLLFQRGIETPGAGDRGRAPQRARGLLDRPVPWGPSQRPLPATDARGRSAGERAPHGPGAPDRARCRRRRPLRRRAHAPRGALPPARARPPRRLALRGGSERDRAHPLRCRQAAKPAAPTNASSRGFPSRATTGRAALRVGPDGWLYLTIGSSCNVCEEQDPRRAAMLRFRPDGSGRRDHRDGPAQLGRLRLAAGER